jgi:hypothetical protein
MKKLTTVKVARPDQQIPALAVYRELVDFAGLRGEPGVLTEEGRPVMMFRQAPLLVFEVLRRGHDLSYLFGKIETGQKCTQCSRFPVHPSQPNCLVCDIDPACAGWLGLCCECGVRVAQHMLDTDELPESFTEIAQLKRAQSLKRWVAETVAEVFPENKSVLDRGRGRQEGSGGRM